MHIARASNIFQATSTVLSYMHTSIQRAAQPLAQGTALRLPTATRDVGCTYNVCASIACLSQQLHKVLDGFGIPIAVLVDSTVVIDDLLSPPGDCFPYTPVHSMHVPQ